MIFQVDYYESRSRSLRAFAHVYKMKIIAERKINRYLSLIIISFHKNPTKFISFLITKSWETSRSNHPWIWIKDHHIFAYLVLDLIKIFSRWLERASKGMLNRSLKGWLVMNLFQPAKASGSGSKCEGEEKRIRILSETRINLFDSYGLIAIIDSIFKSTIKNDPSSPFKLFPFKDIHCFSRSFSWKGSANRT